MRMQHACMSIHPFMHASVHPSIHPVPPKQQIMVICYQNSILFNCQNWRASSSWSKMVLLDFKSCIWRQQYLHAELSRSRHIEIGWWMFCCIVHRFVDVQWSLSASFIAFAHLAAFILAPSIDGLRHSYVLALGRLVMFCGGDVLFTSDATSPSLSQSHMINYFVQWWWTASDIQQSFGIFGCYREIP